MRHVLLHSHLFKNAGSTIDWCLQRSFHDGFVNHREDDDILEAGMDYVKDYVSSSDQIVGLSSHHMIFEPYYSADNICFWYILMLRKPLARALSIYEYERKQSETSPGAKMAKKLDMRGYFEWRLGKNARAVMRNFHTRRLSGVRDQDKRIINGNEFAKALDQSRRFNVLVGFVERFDESMVLFEQVLQPHFNSLDLAYVIQNQSPQSSRNPMAYLKDQLGESLFAKLIEKNVMDMRLYETLEQDFTARIAEIPEFEDKLRALQGRSTALHL